MHEFFDNKDEARARLAWEAVERALLEADGLVLIDIGQEPHLTSPYQGRIIPDKGDLGVLILFSNKFACKNDGFSFPEVEPRLFLLILLWSLSHL